MNDDSLDQFPEIWDKLNDPNRVQVGDVVTSHYARKKLMLVVERNLDPTQVFLYNPKTQKIHDISLWVGYLKKVEL